MQRTLQEAAPPAELQINRLPFAAAALAFDFSLGENEHRSPSVHLAAVAIKRDLLLTLSRCAICEFGTADDDRTSSYPQNLPGLLLDDSTFYTLSVFLIKIRANRSNLHITCNKSCKSYGETNKKKGDEKLRMIVT